LYTARVKNAQEAHEAIRPAGESFRTPEAVRRELEPRELRLYELIWKRTVASQMSDARGQRIVLGVEGGGALFQATGKTIEFPGYLRAYVEGSDDPEAELGDQERVLPDLAQGEAVRCQGLEPQEHRTQPPARYSEASLIKELERQGIGRPSTYASIIDTIVRREYVVKKGNQLVPSFTAIAVVRLLEQYFKQLVDVDFTAQMENALDAISRGEQEPLPYLQRFYHGDPEAPGLKQLIQAEIDPRQACTIPLDDNEDHQHPIAVRIGRFGPYLERDGERAALPADITPDEVTLERAEELLRRGSEPDVLGSDPQSGRTVYLKTGRYGPYVQLGESGEEPKMKSLLPGQTPEQLTLDDALQLLSLPRTVATDPDTDEPVLADLGRYGPYIRRGKDTRSLASPQELFTLTLEQAQALFRQEKSMRRGPTVIREVGAHPESGATLKLMDGRYGPYVSDGEINASIPRGAAPESVTLEEAVALLAERAARMPAGPRRRRAAGKGAKPGAKSGAKTARKAATSAAKASKPAAGTAKAAKSGKAAKAGKATKSGGTRKRATR
jgi:DNA topoisomerase I